MDAKTIFRRRLHRMLEVRPHKYHIADGDDAWGLVVGNKNMPGVMIWYSANKGILTLGLTTASTQRLIPNGLVPDNASFEESSSGWPMFRWNVPKLNLELLPEEQSGATELVDKIKFAFQWFVDNRIT